MKECGRFDCDKPFYKTIKMGRGPKSNDDLCKRHYIQINYTDKILEIIKKYWIIGAIAIAVGGLLKLWI
jgi:hypothetical protein